LSFYLHGAAGAGKSSLSRHFGPTLNASIEAAADPEILVRYVKQNLNKPTSTLNLELDLRPNNNDRSVMSIIQSRRLTMGQSKPGLVVVALEEMASNTLLDADPNQLATAQLISQRFAGRKGDYNDSAAAPPRNSGKRGISGDASVVPLFTSNYKLEEPGREALRKLEMFHNLQCIEMTAVTGADRSVFANQYLRQCISEHCGPRQQNQAVTVQLNIPLGEGDLRPLVRHLRMLSFYISKLLDDDDHANGIESGGTVTVVVEQTGQRCNVHVHGLPSLVLRVGTMDNLFTVPPRVFDARVDTIMTQLRPHFTNEPGSIDFDELALLLNFWLAKTLSPTVIVSSDRLKIQRIIAAIGQLENIPCLRAINVEEYKMMRSLYDPTDTPNLRDDILRRCRSGTGVVVELLCATVNTQLQIREIIEDTPSMTAFSSEKSALRKEGLLFGVWVKGDMTPEVRSRASLVL